MRWSGSSRPRARWATRRRSGSRSSTRWRSADGAMALWSVRPDWLALVALAPGGGPSRQPGDPRRPQGWRRRAGPVPLQPDLRLARLRRDAGGRHEPLTKRRQRLRRGRMLSVTQARETAQHSSSAPPPPGPTRPTRSISATVRRACRCGSASSRMSSAPRARRSGCGCSAARDRRASRRRTCRRMRLRRWSTGRWRWPPKRPRTNMPGSRRPSC